MLLLLQYEERSIERLEWLEKLPLEEEELLEDNLYL